MGVSRQIFRMQIIIGQITKCPGISFTSSQCFPTLQCSKFLRCAFQYKGITGLSVVTECIPVFIYVSLSSQLLHPVPGKPICAVIQAAHPIAQHLYPFFFGKSFSFHCDPAVTATFLSQFPEIFRCCRSLFENNICLQFLFLIRPSDFHLIHTPYTFPTAYPHIPLYILWRLLISVTPDPLSRLTSL